MGPPCHKDVAPRNRKSRKRAAARQAAPFGPRDLIPLFPSLSHSCLFCCPVCLVGPAYEYAPRPRPSRRRRPPPPPLPVCALAFSCRLHPSTAPLPDAPKVLEATSLRAGVTLINHLPAITFHRTRRVTYLGRAFSRPIRLWENAECFASSPSHPPSLPGPKSTI